MALRGSLKSVVILGAFACNGAASAGDVAIRAPLDCSPNCRMSFTTALAFQIDYQKRKALCQERIKKKEGQKSSKGPLNALLCTSHAAVFGSSSCPGHEGRYWAFAEELESGSETLSLLRQRLRSGEPFRIGKSDAIVVEGTPIIYNEQRIAVCDVRVIGKEVGPPLDCSIVAITRGSTTLLRANNIYMPGELHLCTASAVLTSSGGIDVEWNVKTSLKIETFATSLSKMLSNELLMPTLMSTRKSGDGTIDSIHLSSTVGLRNSTILGPGWREAVEIRVSIWSADNGLEVVGYSKPLASRIAAGDLVEYHGLNDAQRGLYANALDARIRSAILSVCSNSELIDARNMICN